MFPGGDGWLYGLEPASGKLIWKFNCSPARAPKQQRPFEKRAHLTATPVVVGHRAYVGVGTHTHGGDPGSKAGHLWCIDIAGTGDLSAQDEQFDPKAAVNKGSGLVWHFGGASEPKPAKGRACVFGETVSSVAVQGGLVYAADRYGFFYCLDAVSGQCYWQHDLESEVLGSPCWADGKIYIGSDDAWIFAHGKNKRLIRRIEMDGVVTSAPIAVGRTLYIAAGHRLVAIGKK